MRKEQAEIKRLKGVIAGLEMLNGKLEKKVEAYENCHNEKKDGRHAGWNITALNKIAGVLPDLKKKDEAMRNTVKDKDLEKRNALAETIFRDEAAELGLDPDGFDDLDEFDQQIYRGRAHKRLMAER